MIVAVQDGLNHLYHELMNLGYTVVFYSKQNINVDAVVYSYPGDYENQPSEINPNITNTGAFNMQSAHVSKAAIMINAYNKSIDEIKFILETKLYSPLF